MEILRSDGLEAGKSDRVKFKINGVEFSVGGEVCSEKTLLDFIRDDAQYSGTKYMCREAGCGACIVSAVTTPGGPVLAVNSCVIPILTCQDWEVTTIEKLGNRKDGYHPIQVQFANHNATQCGYCTPGWIMSLFSFLKRSSKPTMVELEQAFGSNLCRCTGYRPIVEVLKLFAKDAPKNSKQYDLGDIEDLKICDKTGEKCAATCSDNDWCMISPDDIIEICLSDNKKWFGVRYVADIFKIFENECCDDYMLINGNTGKVPFPICEYPAKIIDISKIQELQNFTLDQNLIIGGGVTLTRAIEILIFTATKDAFGYLTKLVKHFKLIAHIPVRNVGTIAGNLMIKHQHNEFPSDVFLCLETVDAMLTIESKGGIRQVLSMQQFLQIDMSGKVIINILLPPLNDDECEVVLYKIMSRAQSVHATVNAGFLYQMNPNQIILSCRIVYGNLSACFNRACATEKYLKGKYPFSNTTLRRALAILEKELVVEEYPGEASVEFRKKLAINLLYKGLLSICPEALVHPRYRSGAIDIRAIRPASKARQVYDTNKTIWPLTQPINKKEAQIQCSGEAQYTDDIPKIAHEHYVSYVVTTVPTGTIVNIDPSKALICQGVVAFFSAKDIPGLNSFTPNDILPYSAYEEVFCGGTVGYLHQPLGIIVAETKKIADKAAKLVLVTYENVKTPVIDIKEAVKDPKRVSLYYKRDATDKGNDIHVEINHKDTIYGQYHFPMETLVCVTRPVDECLEVHAATQWPDGVQLMIAKALNMDANKIDVCVRRVGGGFGFKVSRTSLTAVACALASYKLNLPCRFVQSMTDNTKSMGKRLPCISAWEVCVDNCGVIQSSNLKMYEDNGFMINENFYALAIDPINNCYDNRRWSYECYNVVTDTAKNTWCRSPGTLESIAMAELKMERIATELSLDPLKVRFANLAPQYDELRQIFKTLKINSDYEIRKQKVMDYNAGNRWKKRGLGVSLLRWSPIGIGIFEVVMVVYHGDGTVAITHGGVEIGQGIHTKVAQVCAYLLKIPVAKIQIKCTNTMTVPNNFITGGSMTSEFICSALKKCCEQLLERLAPIRETLGNPTWKELVDKAFDSDISLVVHESFQGSSFKPYVVYGATIAEVEIDVLTAECEVLRVDLMEDVGQSINPAVDIGQIEGAFIMGMGYWTMEKLAYCSSGELLTDRAWNLPIPQILDIPNILNIFLRKQSYSNDMAFGAKCVGEPPLCMSVAVPLAIRAALSDSRLDTGIPRNQWFNIDGPYNLENIGLATNTKPEHMCFI